MRRIFGTALAAVLLLVALPFGLRGGARWRTKPVLGSRIDWSQGITSGLVGAWLMNEGGGTTINSLINTADRLTTSGDAVFGNAATGPAFVCPSTGSFTGALLASPSAALKPSAAVSLFWRGVITGTGATTANPYLAGVIYDNASSSPFNVYAIARRSTGSTDIGAQYNSSGTNRTLAALGVISFGVPVTFAMSRQDGETKLFKDGKLLTSDSIAGTMNSTATSEFLINRHLTTSTANGYQSVDVVYIWNRVVSVAEFAALTASPYQIIRGPALVARRARLPSTNVILTPIIARSMTENLEILAGVR